MRLDDAAEDSDRSASDRRPAPTDREALQESTASQSSNSISVLDDILDHLAAGVRRGSVVGTILFDAQPLEDWEHRHGSEAFDNMLSAFARAVERTRGRALRDGDAICRTARGGDAIAVFLSQSRGDDSDSTSIDFAEIAERAKTQALDGLSGAGKRYRKPLEQLRIGTALIVGKRRIDARRQLYRALRRARDDIHRRRRERLEQLHQFVGRVITRGDIETRFQPVVHLDRGQPIGYEALNRVSSDRTEDPELPLFAAARRVELDAELDELCRKRSVSRRPGLEKDRILFVNTLADAFCEPTGPLDSLLDRWKASGLSSDQLAFEINEEISQREAERILPTIRRLRRRGFEFALDDVGTGETNLRLLAELEPTYIKMDISLTRGISASVEKQALASYLLDLADKSGAKLIAEGIESQRDLDTVRELGVVYAQGYLIGRPGDPDELI